MIVTGGAGFIGTNFVRHWRSVAPGDEIVVLDLLTYAGRADNLAGLDGVTLVVGDIRDVALVERLITDWNADTIVHVAAETHVDRSIAGPGDFVSTNIVGTHHLLEAAKACWLDRGSGRPHRFHHVSTDEVYGSLGLDDPPFTEASRFAPNSPYAASKAAADHLVRAYHRTYGLATTTSHCSNNYGPFQFPEKLVPLAITQALLGRSIPLYGDGRHVRDWLCVEDHVRGIETILRHGGPGEVFNIGGGAEHANAAMLEGIAEAVDRAFAADPRLAVRFPRAAAAQGRPTANLISHVADRQGHDRRYAIDATLMVERFGFVARHDVADGIAATLDWYLDHETWWRSASAAARPAED